jgi:hypothetical protein
MGLQRYPDWPERLATFLLERRSIPFAWGTNDCVMCAADEVMAITGVDLAAAYRGTYSDAQGAATTIAAGTSLYALACSVLGQPLDAPTLAQRGDIIWIAPDSRETLGIVCGSGEWCAPGDEGLVFMPMDEVAIAWRV